MPTIAPFQLERYFAKYEFKVKYLLSPSDCESLTLNELLQLADPDSLRLWHSLNLCYTESPGHPALREEIARMYEHAPPAQIVVAAPEELIFIAMHTLLRSGDHVVCISPAYQSLYEVARAIGCDVAVWPVEEVEGQWRLDLNRLESAITDRTRLLVVNFPHNPTGYLPTRRDIDSVIELARRRNLFLFCDEMYRLLEYDEAGRLPPMCDLYERGISLSGLSKTFALPGLRLGWLATQDSTLPEQWLTFKDYTTICNSAPSEILGLMALRAADSIIARNLQIIRSNIRIAEQFCGEHASLVRWFPPRAGSIAFPKWLGRAPIEQVCQSAVDEREVMVVPGSIFDFPGQHFRVGLGRKNFAEALEQFGAHVQLRG
ncbi:MAG: aminotransferase class I/II-fold pyridoxal phosphate-dependent enzyme [Chloroflexi bacterium]|nr:aminotransferase class I/II-fold pyridoxal phosphate-dependent enzyme [Chloroflexota bacterium]